jgi:hypothetical protein
MATVFGVLVSIPVLITFPMEMKIEELKAKGVEVMYCQDRWEDVRQSVIGNGHEWNRYSWGSFLSAIDDLQGLDYDVIIWVCYEDRVLWFLDTRPAGSYCFIYGDDF